MFSAEFLSSCLKFFSAGFHEVFSSSKFNSRFLIRGNPHVVSIDLLIDMSILSWKTVLLNN